MKKYWIEYQPTWSPQPMSYWVHIEQDGKTWYAPGGMEGRSWYEGRVFDPPVPRPVPGKGYPVYFVELDGFIFQFSSLAELDVCVHTFQQKALPTPLRLTALRGGEYDRLNHHWLSRMPGKVKAWRYRQKAIAYFQEVRSLFLKQIS